MQKDIENVFNLLCDVLLSMIVLATGFIKSILANKIVTIEKVTYTR